MLNNIFGNRHFRQTLVTVLVTFFVTSAGFLAAYNLFLRPQLKEGAVVLDVLHQVERNALSEPELVRLKQGAIDGIIASTDDPYSYYLPPRRFLEMAHENEGYFEGVGIEVMMEKEGLRVIAPIRDTPADLGGMQPKDLIIAVDGTSTAGMTVNQAISRIRGPEGTEVDLEVLRDGEDRSRHFRLIRGKIPIETVDGEMLANKIGYIVIDNFSDTTAAEFDVIFKRLQDEGARGLVLDLRNNPGGSVKSCAEIAQRIVPRGRIVTVRYRDGSENVYKSELDKLVMPYVVLVNGGSASASEILTGAVQDSKVAPIIGTTTFGKGVVQTVSSLGNGGGLILTVAEYMTPKGRKIHEKGITPDYIIEQPDESETDVQLEFALEKLLESI
jgi:carboxyl-terminal processing protease